MLELEKLAEEFPQVKLVSEKRMRNGEARNIGRAGDGRVFCFLEPDDELLSDYFKQVVPILDSHAEFSSIKVGIQF
ncbi:MAG: hypothetical protein HT580_10360 [Dechloromonas sp.]|nr:MAG: hypothetical protein HT580_10360 [Dechloromonas sp.]